jgi:hypothetical protein
LIKRIEALADALAVMNRAWDPESEAYKTRNPGLLKWHHTFRHPVNENFVRIFTSFIGGYRALIEDLRIKASGENRSKLKPDSPLLHLVRVYGQPDTAADYLVKFLRRALRDEEISPETKLQFFLE